MCPQCASQEPGVTGLSAPGWQQTALWALLPQPIGRQSAEHGVIITQELENHFVTLEAVTEDVDNTELGKLITYIKGFAAKLDAERRREATLRGYTKSQFVQ